MIDDDTFEKIDNLARELFRKANSGGKGCAIMKEDSFEYWIAIATKEILEFK